MSELRLRVCVMCIPLAEPAWAGIYTRQLDLNCVDILQFLGWLPSGPAVESRVPLVTSDQSGWVWVSMAPSRRHRRSSHGTAGVISLPR